jgi:anti-sigma factor RsiW
VTYPGPPIGDDDLQAWADRRLPPDRHAAVDAYLAAHPEVTSRLARYAVQATELTDALQPKFEEPIPARLRIDTLLARRRSRLTGHLARAASILLVAGLSGAGGWALHGWTAGRAPLRAATANAVAAYQTFTVEARHPVEVRAEEGAHLVQWISNRLNRPITPPDLAPLGWRLMGGRVLPTANAPAAQLMYDDDRGTRLTVYVQPMGIDGEEFRYTQQGDVRTIVWAERRLALVVTGKVNQDTLLAVARRVKDELGQGGAP